MGLEEPVGKRELRRAVGHVEREVGPPEPAVIVGAGEIDEVAARLAGAGSVREGLLERRSHWSRVSDKVVRVIMVEQRVITKGD